MDDVVAMLNGLFPELARMDMPSRMLAHNVYSCLPYPAVATSAPLSAAAVACGRGADADQFSRLPPDLLRDIVSRLPVKDAVRTSTLSRSWRGVWRSAPLVLVDAHLTPSSDLVAAVSDALGAHPGPFASVHLTGSPGGARRVQVERWLELLATKRVDELVLLNRPTRIHDNKVKADLPCMVFFCTSLTRLYVGYCKFPDTTLPPGALFPRLRELGLCAVDIHQRDLTYVLDNCPLLAKLLIIGTRCGVPIQFRSRSLRCIQVCNAEVREVVVDDAERLERLLLWEAWGTGGTSSTIRISNASTLRYLGNLVPRMHKLVIGSTTIRAWTPASPYSIVPSVEMLAIMVNLGACSEIKQIPSFLRCFPNINTLYINCEKDDSDDTGSTSRISPRFWEEAAGPAECVRKHIKKVVLRGLRGTRSEILFLKFLAERVQALEKIVIVADHDFDGVCLKVATLMSCARWANDSCKVKFRTTEGGSTWCFNRAFNLSNKDPFNFSKCRSGKCVREY